MIGTVSSFLLILFGICLTVLGAYVGFVTLPNYVEEKIIDAVVLKDDTIQYERWKTPPFPVNFTVYFFNITNPEHVLVGDDPIVEEIGPYIYKQYRYNQVLDKNEDTITFLERMWMEFDEVSSLGRSEGDNITIVNVPFNAVLQVAEKESPSLMFILNNLLASLFGVNVEPIITTTVRDILFDGVTICQNPSIVGSFACSTIRDSAADSKNIEVHGDGSMAFSFFKSKQNGTGEMYTIKRGIENHAELGLIQTWNSMSELQTWGQDVNGGTSLCNMINGTNSAIYRPKINTSEDLMAFNPDICRSVLLSYKGHSDYLGVDSVRYEVGDWLFSNREDCFCIGVTDGVVQNDSCLYSGVMELFSCTGAYLVASSPHFLYADPIYQTGVVGLEPMVEKHSIFVELEPSTGTLLRGSKRAQFNIFLRPILSITNTESLTPKLVPIFWVEDSMNLPEEYVNEIKSSLYRPRRIIYIVRIVVIVLGCSSFIIGLILGASILSCKKKTIK